MQEPTISPGEYAVDSESVALRVQICDYLFERGHRISKPLVDDMAKFARDYGKALYEQGKLAAAKDQPCK